MMSFFEPRIREADEGSFDAVSRQDLIEKARGVDMDDDGVVNLSLVEAERRASSQNASRTSSPTMRR